MIKVVNLSLLAISVVTAFTLTACTNPTSTAGTSAYFTEGVVKDIEVISIDQKKYDNTKNIGIGAAGGAVLGQIIGGNTKGTLIGAGIGAIIGGGASMIGNSADGMRLTVDTANGLQLVDTLYSCLIRKNTKIRMVNHKNGIQIQVLTTSGYKTATADPVSKCKR